MTTPHGGLRVRRPPALDEPFDDERSDHPTAVVGALALSLPGLDRPRPDVSLRLVPPAQAPDRPGTPGPVGPTAARLAQAIAEVLAGGRSAAQLSDHATLDVLRQLERWTGRLFQRGPRTVQAAVRPRVSSVHISEPAERVAEVCVVIDTGVRRRALAFRLEARGRGWRCTALQLG